MQLSPELIKKAEAKEVSLVQLAMEDLELYAELNLKIQTKGAELTPFRFNACQKILHARAEDQKRRTGKVRIILLKARQFGGTTYIASRLYKHCSTKMHEHGKVIAHDEDASVGIFDTYERYYTHSLPMFQPMTKYKTKRNLFFENPSRKKGEKDKGLESSIGVFTAGGKGVGRSKTIRHLHCSEVPHWPETKKTMLGLLNTVPKGEDGKGTEVFIESTAKGVGDWFYNKYYSAKNKEPGEEFEAVFIPWYTHEAYTVPEYAADLTQEEQDLLEREHDDWDYVNPRTGKKTLSLGQVLWRRQTIATECDRNVDQFMQEYPMTDTEAFLTAGLPFFPIKAIDARINEVANITPALVGEVDVYETNAKDQRKLYSRIVESEYGSLTIYREPKKGEDFVFGADIGEGIRGADYSVADFLSIVDGYQCAQWRGIIVPDQFAKVLYALGKYFNWAFGSPEVNNHGLTVLDRLRFYRYPRLYMEKRFDRRTKEETERMGWLSTMRNRFTALDTLRRMFADGDIIINSLETMKEARTFVKEKNKWQAQAGCHDDCIISAAIAAMMLMDKPKQRLSRVTSSLQTRTYSGNQVRYNPTTGWPE
jgi:hypothetical protein